MKFDMQRLLGKLGQADVWTHAMPYEVRVAAHRQSRS